MLLILPSPLIWLLIRGLGPGFEGRLWIQPLIVCRPLAGCSAQGSSVEAVEAVGAAKGLQEHPQRYPEAVRHCGHRSIVLGHPLN